jgi:hypothetical protein
MMAETAGSTEHAFLSLQRFEEIAFAIGGRIEVAGNS